MQKIIFRWLLIAFIPFFTSCTTLPPPAQNQSISWEQRSTMLSSIQSWNIKGAIGIRTAQDNVSAILNWQQQQQNYTISLFGPLGTNSFVLTGQPNQAELAMGDGRKFTARNPETILAEQLHWQLPVSNLFYWVRGLPVPNIPDHKQFDAYQHIIELVQQGWRIQFSRYTTINGIDVPTKIVLTYPELTVKIVINQWQI